MKWQRYIVGILLIGLLAACGDKNSAEDPTTAVAVATSSSAADITLPPPATTVPPSPTSIPPTPTPMEPLAAVVNGQPIFLAFFEKELARYEQGQIALGLAPTADTAADRATVLHTLIEQTLIAQAAAARNIAITPDMVTQKLAELKASAVDEASFQAWLQANQWTEEEFRDALAVDMLTERMKTELTADVPYAVPQVHARYIQVNDAALAQSLLEQIRAGGDFADLARQYSLDRHTGENGGDLDFFPAGTLLVPAVDQAAQSLEVDQVSEVIVAVGSDGSETYYIIQVLEKDPQRALTPQQRAVMLQETFEQWLDGLWADADITRYVDAGG